MSSIMATLRVGELCDSVAKNLGYSSLKDVQKDLISSVVLGHVIRHHYLHVSIMTQSVTYSNFHINYIPFAQADNARVTRPYS